MPGRSRVRGGALPVLARIAGLPVETVERLSSGLSDEVAALAALEAELGTARAALADRLFERVPGAPPELRRLLLAVRRDCHNGRSLARHRASPGWAALGPLAGGVAELEARAETARAAFRRRFAEERERQRRALREPLEDPAFVRGLALASADLAEAALALRGAPSEARGRREARAEAALLKYVTRAAVKVSPFSTFTPVALGRLSRDAGPAGLRLRGAGWRSRSLLRLRRYRLQQCVEMLVRYAPFRERLAVVFNDSAAETEPGRLLLVRPGCWEADAERGTLRHRADALVRTAAADPLTARLAEILAEGCPSLGELVARLEAEAAGPEEAGRVREEIERLVELGLLRLVLPWPVHEGHLERRLCEVLRTLPADPALEAFTERLERLVALERGYARTPRPLDSLAEIRRLTRELWETAAPLAGVDPGAVAPRAGKAFDLYEDVLLLPSAGEPGGAPVVEMSRGAAREALRSAAPLMRLGGLFDHRHDFHATLSDAARERWPGRSEVGVLELFAALQPLWQEYAAFRSAWWKARDRRAVWNPRGLPEVEEIGRLRAETLDGLAACSAAEGDAVRVSEEALEALLARVPARLLASPGRGACLLLQPASTDGSLWRLNELREGTGRVGSRYTPVMPAGMRRRLAAHLAARGVVRSGGEEAFLLDVQCAAGDTLNVHAPLAPAVLALPGEEAGVAPRRRVRLGELRVRFGGPGERATLRGADGRLLLPVHLGLAFEGFMPGLLRFLYAFGPSEWSPVFPPRPARQEGEVEVTPRTLLGNLVLRRRAWSVPAAPLLGALSAPEEADAFAALNRLRAAWGVPERVFFAEPIQVPHVGTHWKPQYLDFTSPLFLPLLRSALEAGGERLALEEMLPDFGACPPDGAGRRWAVEVVLDSAALRSPRLKTHARTGRLTAANAGGSFPPP